MSDLYLSPDSNLPVLGFLVLLVCIGFIGVTFTLLCVGDKQKWKRYTLLGSVAAALIVIAAILLIGPGTVQDSEAQWSCPTALQGIQLEPAPGKALPEGVAGCRDISYRNVTLAGIATAGGVAIALGGIISRRRPRASRAS